MKKLSRDDLAALDALILEQAFEFCRIKEARTDAIRKRNSHKCTEADETQGACRLYDTREESEWCEQCRLHEEARSDERELKSFETKAVRKMCRLVKKRTYASQAEN